jgi:hypothetical protein
VSLPVQPNESATLLVSPFKLNLPRDVFGVLLDLRYAANSAQLCMHLLEVEVLLNVSRYSMHATSITLAFSFWKVASCETDPRKNDRLHTEVNVINTLQTLPSIYEIINFLAREYRSSRCLSRRMYGFDPT